MFRTMKSQSFARFTCLVATLSLTAIATGCTQDEMDSAMAGAGIALIGAAILDDGSSPSYDHRDHDSGHYECVGGERTVCQESRDYYGRPNRVCRTTYDSCADRRYVRDFEGARRMPFAAGLEAVDATGTDESSAMVAIDASSNVNEVSMAQTFGLSFDAAATILNALEKAKAGDHQALDSLGLSGDDRRALASLNLPADAGIDSMARTLNQDPAVVKSMLTRLIDIGQKQQAAQTAVMPYMIN